MAHYHSPDINLRAYQNALCDKPSNKDLTSLDVLKYSYLHLNDKWRGNLILILCDLAEEIKEKWFTWETFSYLSDYYNLNPNAIQPQDIKELFEWIQS
jgi:hypothetical protein